MLPTGTASSALDRLALTHKFWSPEKGSGSAQSGHKLMMNDIMEGAAEFMTLRPCTGECDDEGLVGGKGTVTGSLVTAYVSVKSLVGTSKKVGKMWWTILISGHWLQQKNPKNALQNTAQDTSTHHPDKKKIQQ